MRQPIIQLGPQRERAHHPGLLLQRYLAYPADKSDRANQERRELFRAAVLAGRSESLRATYDAAYNRWNASFPKDGMNPFAPLHTTGRLIVGLGSENVLETGIRLQHTYGVPLIPGSALKGLAAHYCHEVWGQRHVASPDETTRSFRRGKDFHCLLFGTTADGGTIAFHDAWITPASLSDGALRLDVMTPHHPDWQTDATKAPTDFDSPVPISFLSVAGTFQIRLSWAGPSETPQEKALAWTSLAMRLLQEALAEWGVGGKTSSGYGRLTLPPPPPTPLKKRVSGEKAKVKIIALRAKGGFDVEDVEQGRKRGTLTVGSPPPATDTNLGSIVDVLVHDDKAEKPQYKWPQAPKK